MFDQLAEAWFTCHTTLLRKLRRRTEAALRGLTSFLFLRGGKLQTTLEGEKEVKKEYDPDLCCTRCNTNLNEDLPSAWRFGKLRPLLRFDRKRRELYCVKCGLVKDRDAS
jgi:hypothetical protein